MSSLAAVSTFFSLPIFHNIHFAPVFAILINKSCTNSTWIILFFSCNILVKNGSPEILSVYVREVSLPLASNQGASNPRIWQLISRHERNNPSLLSSKWRWSTFSNHGRADLQGHLPLYRVSVSYHPTSKGLLYGCRWSCSSRENESSRFLRTWIWRITLFVAT